MAQISSRFRRASAAALCTAPLLLIAPTLEAQESRGPRVLRLPASTRAMALGDAYMMNAGHADAVFYHPALVQGASGFGLDVQTWSGASSSSAASAAVAWLGGSVAIGLQTLHFDGPPGDLGAYPVGQDLLFDRGATPVSERVASLAYAREIFGVRAGLTAKLLDERFDTSNETTGALDVGLAKGLGPVTVGLSARNLGRHMDVGREDVSLPTAFTLGVGSYGRPLGPLDVGFTGALTYESDELIPAGGIEFGYWPVPGRTFVGRIGARRVVEGDGNPLSVGAAFWGDDIVLEWAYRPFGGTVDDGTHRFGVRWR